MPITVELENPTIRGAEFRQTHALTVQGVLAGREESPPKVSSRGTAFFNVDRWTLRIFTFHMCKWAQENPACVPTRTDVGVWVSQANDEEVRNREIVIANTPDALPVRTAMALVGGGYHEAWHTLYSCRRALTLDEMCDMVIPRWAKIPNWAAVHGILQDWGNIIEDIRIERLGCREFPGSPGRMADLQNFILDLEADGLYDARRHSAKKGGKTADVKRGTLSIVSGAFRDMGLGYKTRTQQIAWDGYVKAIPEAVKMVTEGLLSPMLQEAIHLTEADDTGCLRVAMDCLVVLVQESGKQDQEHNDRDEAENGEQGDGEQKCKRCGAPAYKLIVRPKADGSGGKVRGIGIVTCTICGHQEEVQVKARNQRKNRDQQLKDAAKSPGPKWEGWDQGDFDQEDESENAQSKGEKTPGDEGEGSEEFDDGQGGSSSDDKPNTSQQKGASMGADDAADEPIEGNDWSKVAQGFVGEAEQGKGTGLKDNNEALGESVATATEKEEGKPHKGEQVYRPYDQGLDDVIIVPPSKRGRSYDTVQANNLLASVQAQTSFLRARLANMVRAMEQTNIVHGTQQGIDLSEPFLVDTALEIMSGQRPQRAYCQQDDVLDTSMAACIVLDESSSMLDTAVINGRRCTLTEIATRVMIAITEPLDRLGIPVQATGFRNGRRGCRGYHGQGQNEGTLTPPEKGEHHRFGGHITDVFKTFDEKFRDVMWRFANTRGTGGTPMADGMQFGLDSLNYRNEGHRVMFVVTDGCPSGGHGIIQRQLRLAKETGIHIIGVGLGEPARYVKTLFPDHVWSKDFNEFPILLLNKLNELIDVKASKRGQRMKV